MITVRHECKNCIHNEVCNFKSEYNKTIDALNSTSCTLSSGTRTSFIELKHSMFTIVVGCPHYHKATIVNIRDLK